MSRALLSARPECGALRFGDDWTGLFLRGDVAMAYRLALDSAIAHLHSEGHAFDRVMLECLRDALAECREPVSPLEVQQLRPWAECVALPDASGVERRVVDTTTRST